MAQPAAQRARPQARPQLTALAFGLASACLLVFQLGYTFETGDQLQYLLLPYRELFANFLPGDWFTWHTSHYHLSFSWLVRAVHSIAGPTGFARAMFLVHCLNLAWFGYAIWRLALALGLGPVEASFCVGVLALVRQIGLAGAVVNHAGLVPADLALAPFLLAAAASCERRSLALGCWLGISGLLHANYAVLGPMLLFPLELWRARRLGTWADCARSALAFGLIASPSLVLLLGTFLARDPAPAAVAITLFVRSPHHYDLAAMRSDDFYFAALLWLLSTAHLARGDGGPARDAHRRLSALFLACIVLAAVGSGLHVLAITRLFGWRMSIPLYALWLLALGAGLRRFALERDWVGLGWGVSGCVLLVTFVQRDPLELSPWNTMPLWAAGMLAAFGAATAAQLWLHARTRAAVCALGCAAGIAVAGYVALPASRAGAGLAARLHFLDAPIQIEPQLRKLFQVVRERTPADARFLIPPGQNQFRLHARRSVFVDWKCAPMKGDEALEWKRRMLLAMGTPDFPARGYELPRVADNLYYVRPLSELASLARTERLTHVLARRSNAGSSDATLRKLFTVGDYVIYEL